MYWLTYSKHAYQAIITHKLSDSVIQWQEQYSCCACLHRVISAPS